jgi:hypothetical protein
MEESARHTTRAKKFFIKVLLSLLPGHIGLREPSR